MIVLLTVELPREIDVVLIVTLFPAPPTSRVVVITGADALAYEAADRPPRLVELLAVRAVPVKIVELTVLNTVELPTNTAVVLIDT